MPTYRQDDGEKTTDNYSNAYLPRLFIGQLNSINLFKQAELVWTFKKPGQFAMACFEPDH
jgi:hypothetical protein